MKKSVLLVLGAVAAASAGVAASSGVKPNFAEAKAAVSAADAVTGTSGEILFVSGVTDYFAESGEKSSDLAIYFWREATLESPKIETWLRGDRTSIHNDTYAVTIPQYNSEDVTWDSCIVTRLKRDAATPGWSNLNNKSADISFTDFANPKKNLISPKGYLGDLLDYDLLNTNGVVSGDILYLNVNSSTDWMAAGAKLSCYFFGTTTSAGEPNAWADFGSVVGIGPSSSTVVKIIVPQDSGANVTWRSVIVARFDPKYAGDKPSNFDHWGQTGDYHFKDAAEDNNVLNLDKDGGGYKVNGAQTFSGSDVANYYGQYFINEVGCDSDGVNKPSGWETVKSAYLALPGSVQTIIAGTTHGASESAIEAAMLTYDWAISHNPTLKNSPTERFISGRTGNGASAVTTISGNSLNSGALIAGLALFGVAAAGTMIFFAKKRKEI